jgi:putative N6-adenine-specific DNA methylase
MDKYEMVATTLMGLEDVLAKEIKALGGEKVKILKRAVSFVGDDALLYKANLSLRTALRVLVPLSEFRAHNEEKLYREVKDFPWEDVFSLEQTFIIDAVLSGTVFRHSHFLAQKTKDAIVDRFRARTGQRPSIDTQNPDIYLNIRVHEDKVTLSINASGLSLDRRGYRRVSNEAPINEVLAAGIILHTGWNATQPFLDPMAGSGTFSIEAAMIGTSIPSGWNRSFSFQNWLEFDANLYEKVRFELNKKISDPNLQIHARDLLNSSLELIAKNAEKAGVEDYLSLKKEDFFESEPKGNGGVVVLNPPYGERLKISNADAFYKKIGDTLKQRYKGFDAWIISSDLDALRSIGLRAEEKIEMMNGGLPARLLKFEMF